jgi:four helix bundle protein
MKMEATVNDKPYKLDIPERTATYSLSVIKLYRFLRGSDEGKILGKQLLRSATSIGANVHEAQGAQSKADFIAKMSIAYKEAREADYWLKLVVKSELGNKELLSLIQGETAQLLKILSSILITTKKHLSSQRAHS